MNHPERKPPETGEELQAFSTPGLPSDTEDVSEAEAPLIRNAWYVVALRTGVDRTLRGLTVLGEPLVFYRTEAGEPIVLDDRCAHRRFPLSKSTLVGDVIQCGYHGFKYAASGQCVWAPGVDGALKFGVRAYPCAERGPWLWVWMGDPLKADEEVLPFKEDLIAANLTTFTGYKFNPGNYLLLIENLLDLNHIHFLHGAEATTLEHATAQPRAVEVAGGVGWRKQVPHDRCGQIALWCGGNPAQEVSTELVTHQIGPVLNIAVQTQSNLPDGDTSPIKPSSFQIIHALTPRDQHSTHQFYALSLSHPLVMPEADVKHIVEGMIFEQDVEAIGYMQQAIISERRCGKVEFGIASDKYGLTMRKKLREMKALEQ